MNRRIKRKLEKRDNIKNWRNYKFCRANRVGIEYYYGCHEASGIRFCGFKASSGCF